ncbi:hypothetical protein HDV00_002684 [Rhizophlyctis rosea]|nr:hypothetical protein HDV00_002684 [Rhizophlyctis rosea]
MMGTVPPPQKNQEWSMLEDLLLKDAVGKYETWREVKKHMGAKKMVAEIKSRATELKLKVLRGNADDEDPTHHHPTNAIASSDQSPSKLSTTTRTTSRTANLKPSLVAAQQRQNPSTAQNPYSNSSSHHAEVHPKPPVQGKPVSEVISQLRTNITSKYIPKTVVDPAPAAHVKEKVKEVEGRVEDEKKGRVIAKLGTLTPSRKAAIAAGRAKAGKGAFEPTVGEGVTANGNGNGNGASPFSSRNLFQGERATTVDGHVSLEGSEVIEKKKEKEKRKDTPTTDVPSLSSVDKVHSFVSDSTSPDRTPLDTTSIKGKSPEKPKETSKEKEKPLTSILKSIESAPAQPVFDVATPMETDDNGAEAAPPTPEAMKEMKTPPRKTPAKRLRFETPLTAVEKKERTPTRSSSRLRARSGGEGETPVRTGMKVGVAEGSGGEEWEKAIQGQRSGPVVVGGQTTGVPAGTSGTAAITTTVVTGTLERSDTVETEVQEGNEGEAEPKAVEEASTPLPASSSSSSEATTAPSLYPSLSLEEFGQAGPTPPPAVGVAGGKRKRGVGTPHPLKFASGTGNAVTPGRTPGTEAGRRVKRVRLGDEEGSGDEEEDGEEAEGEGNPFLSLEFGEDEEEEEGDGEFVPDEAENDDDEEEDEEDEDEAFGEFIDYGKDVEEVIDVEGYDEGEVETEVEYEEEEEEGDAMEVDVEYEEEDGEEDGEEGMYQPGPGEEGWLMNVFVRAARSLGIVY